MESLLHAIETIPIIDQHAHNLLLPTQVESYKLISITTEARGNALDDVPSTLSHIRAVKQLSEILKCPADWEAVQAAIVKKRKEPDNAWSRRCFEGIETVLIDDGLDDNVVHPYQWHDCLTRSPCKRIVRIEKVAEMTLKSCLHDKTAGGSDHSAFFESWNRAFVGVILSAIRATTVVGFKSVICYRTGLALPEHAPEKPALLAAVNRILASGNHRLEDADLSPYFVHLTARCLSRSSEPHKPIQFHTGLGDNDLSLSSASPALLQPFVKTYPRLPIVLLHASYPFTKEGGYLASVYDNVFLDIGEVFPMVSQDGQESIVRESLELCPSRKLLWSTDGHWFPETYLLAVIQVREALKHVLKEKVTRQGLEIHQAIKIVQDVFFNTANRIYNLELSLTPMKLPQRHTACEASSKIKNLEVLTQLLDRHPSVKFLRLQWLDYTATLRTRVIPIKVAVDMFSQQKTIGITKAVLGLIHQDMMVSGFTPVGEYDLLPCFEGLRLGARPKYATVQGEFREKDGSSVLICPRSALRRIVEKAQNYDIQFLVGFEIEVVFISCSSTDDTRKYGKETISQGHSWSNAGALRNPKIMDAIEEIVATLEASDINLQQFHPESAPGQYEFVTGPLPPLLAVDALVASRDIIYTIAEKHFLRATLIPKPYPLACGTGAHVHISLTPPTAHLAFYAAILHHLPAILAFTYSNTASYQRMQDSVWSGGRYIAWGTQNRETPLRKIEGAHWEIKCMDGLANPYLAMTAILGAGLQGVLEQRPLWMRDCASDPALLDDEARTALDIVEQLPGSFDTALECLRRDGEMKQILGEELVDVYLRVKAEEMKMLDGMEEEARRLFLLERY